MNAFQAYGLRVAIGLDAFCQAVFRFGTLGITISSRAGTAAAHGHRWGYVMWWLLDRVWPFGPDLDGRPHCASAIVNDIARAKAAIVELEDPVVQAYLKQFPPK